MRRARRQVIFDEDANRLPWFIKKEPLLVCAPRPSTGLYATLGVPNDATTNELKHAWYRVAEKHHPDKNNGAPSQMYVEARNAYGFLSDPVTRRFYDRHERIPPDYIFLEKQTLNLFEQVTAQLMEQANGEFFDFLTSTRNTLVAEKEKVGAQIKSVETAIKDKQKQQDNLLRLWRGEERLKNLFLSRIQGVTTQAKQSMYDLEVRLKVINHAIARLEDTSYNLPENTLQNLFDTYSIGNVAYTVPPTPSWRR